MRHLNTKMPAITGLLVSIIALNSIIAPHPPFSFPVSLWRSIPMMMFVCFLPGLAIVEWLLARHVSFVERLLLAIGMGYTVTIVGGLWLYYLFGQLTMHTLVSMYGIISIVGFSLAILQKGHAHPSLSAPNRACILHVHKQPRNPYYLVLLVTLILLSTYFIFLKLDYSDYRGDEAEVVLRAIAVVRGEGNPIFSHTKGPAEVIVTVSSGLLYGSFAELPTRLPFAFGNWLAIIGTFLLGYHVFGKRVALIGLMLIVINGSMIAHSRLAQYQNIVLPMSVLAVWCYVRFYHRGNHFYHLLGNIFIVVAMLGHYDGAASLPALLFLFILGMKRHHTWNQHTQLWISMSFLLGIIIFVSFYAPFFLSPTVIEAQELISKRIGGSPPYNNWDAFYVNGLTFNSIYYMWGIGFVLLVGTLWGIRKISTHTVAIIALPFLIMSWTGILPAWYATVIYMALMGIFLLSAKVSQSLKVILLWLLLPFGLYLFFVIHPGNHYYIFMPPLMLLTAFVLERMLFHLRGTLLLGSFLLIVLWGLSAYYEHIVFMRTDLEYILTYPKHKHILYPTDSRFPFKRRIGWGFPYRLGWRTIANLYGTGELAGDWYGNDENNSILWYTQGSPRQPCFPKYFILTEIGYENPQLPVPLEIIEKYYTHQLTVQVNEQPRLRLYKRTFVVDKKETSPIVHNEPLDNVSFEEKQFLAKDFQGNPLKAGLFQPSNPLDSPHRFKPHPNMLAELENIYHDPNTIYFEDTVALLGYDIDKTHAKSGGVIFLTLYWKAETAVILPYKVFVHFGDETIFAQADDEPACGHQPTYQWRTGDEIIDRHVIVLPDDIPEGTYPIQVGLYEIRSGLRMDALDEMNNPAGNKVVLPDLITIK